MIEKYNFIDIVIRRDVLDNKVKGLSQDLIDEYKIKIPHYDNDLICIRGGMSSSDAQIEIEKLKQHYDLNYNPHSSKDNPTDIVIIYGPLRMVPHNSWLKYKTLKLNDRKLIQFYLER